MKSYIPIIEWLSKYNKESLKGDISAGLTVGVMLIPQGMAYAMIAGLPPIYGLYASTIPIILYSIFGTSRQLAVGPVAMVSLLTAASVGVLAESGTETYIVLTITLAFMVGFIQLFLGVLKLGFLVNFLSHPVISGFTSAAALIIGLSQLKHLLGISISGSNPIHKILIDAISQYAEIHWLTLGIGMVGIFLIIGIKKINKSIPGPLLAVLFGILTVYFWGLDEMGVKIVGTIPSGLPSFSAPSFEVANLKNLIPAAITISLVSFMESIAVAKAIQAKHKNYKLIPNQELIGLGIANIGGSFFQSFPVTGGFSRTAVNDQAGAKTGMAGIISAGLILLTLLFFTPLFYFLPQTILASVIMVAVFGLIDFKEPLYLWVANRSDFWMLIVTFLSTLILGIEEGILIGVILSLAMIIYRSSSPHVAELGNVPGSHFYRNQERFPEVIITSDKLILRFDAEIYFANTDFFKNTLDEWIEKKGDALKNIIINSESINNLDSSALHTLEDLILEQRSQGREIFFTGVKGPVRDAMKKGGFTQKIGESNFFMSVQQAVNFIDHKTDSQDEKTKEKYTSQVSK